MQKSLFLFVALCAMASAAPSNFNNDVILGRREAVTVGAPCGCYSSACKVVLPTNGVSGTCSSTLAHGSTCKPGCADGYTVTGTDYTCTLGVLGKLTGCLGKPCTGLTTAKVQPAGATATAACAALVTATTMLSGSTCGFTCPANQVTSTATTCTAGVLTIGTCKASYCNLETAGLNADGAVLSKAEGGAGTCVKEAALGSTCTPKVKDGYTCTGSVKCAATSAAGKTGAVTEDFTCTAAACDASAAPANGGVGTCTNSLAHGATCQPTCNTGFTVSGPSSCSAGKLTAATCKANTCDFSAKIVGATVPAGCKTTAAGASCTPTCNDGYKASGAFKCSADGKTKATNTFQCTAQPCDASTAPTNGAVGTCTNNLTSGTTCQPTCNAGYTVSGPTSCKATKVTPATCQKDCTTKLVKPTDAISAKALKGTGASCTAGGTLKGSGSCNWGNVNTGYTCTSAKCMGGTLTQATCAQKPCDTSRIPTNGALGNCGKTLNWGQECQKTCNDGFEPNVNTKATCVSGVKVDTFTCKAKPVVVNTCTITAPSNGAIGNCNTGGTTASGTSCRTTCSTGYIDLGVARPQATCTNGVATCGCHSSCKPNMCLTTGASGCTGCRDGFKLTVPKASTYTFDVGTCTWATTYTAAVAFTQTAKFSMTADQFKTQAKNLAKGYGIALGLATAAGWKKDCKGTATIVSRRAITINFAATSSAALAAAAAVAGTTLTAAQLTTAMQTAGVPAAIRTASSVGTLSIGAATSTGIAAMTTVAVMVAGLFWQ